MALGWIKMTGNLWVRYFILLSVIFLRLTTVSTHSCAWLAWTCLEQWLSPNYLTQVQRYQPRNRKYQIVIWSLSYWQLIHMWPHFWIRFVTFHLNECFCIVHARESRDQLECLESQSTPGEPTRQHPALIKSGTSNDISWNSDRYTLVDIRHTPLCSGRIWGRYRAL